MIIETETQPKWSTYVVSVVPGKIITAGWVNLKTKRMGTPDNHSSLVVNPVTKIWSANFNLIFPEGGEPQKVLYKKMELLIIRRPVKMLMVSIRLFYRNQNLMEI
ncbi:hypothetical protein CYU58_15860 [Escherichia coli]|nr:hypothetical protein CYU58_15860 [Escherichia coli]